MDYTCLFGGGAIRGVAYVGAIKALEELGISPVNIGGSSVGSAVAALMAVGYDATDIKELFLDVNFDLFRDIQLQLGPKIALSKGELFLNWIRELIEVKFYGENYDKGKNRSVTFKDLEKNLTIITTDISNFKCQEFSKTATPDFEIATAVRISCGMPGLMKPYEYNNTLLVDGDLQKSMPMWQLSKNILNENERVLEFRLEGQYVESDKNALDYANTVYSCITSICTDFISNMYGKRDKFDYVTLNTGNVIVVDFNCPREKRELLIKEGYEQTMKYFKEVLPIKKEKLLDTYYAIDKSIRHVQGLIKGQNILKAKQDFCELFVSLCEAGYTIDSVIYKAIKKLYTDFDKNIKYPALFGRVTLTDYDKIKSEADNVAEMLSDKIFELESYIVKFPIV